ncbi:MAG: hypothetical protein UH211_03985 [Agathobacter sp.]|nr:hypothetical protein [Agathobacter sp.]
MFWDSFEYDLYLSPTEIKASGGLQECADENVSKADAHSATRTLKRS